MNEVLDDFDRDESQQPKSRHGCVTAWLVLMIVLNSISSLSYIFIGDMISAQLPSSPSKIFLLAVAGFGIVNVICAIYIFKWKKIGFYGFIATSLIMVPINMSMGVGTIQSFSGLLGLAILYGILQIRGSNNQSAWDGLE